MSGRIFHESGKNISWEKVLWACNPPFFFFFLLFSSQLINTLKSNSLKTKQNEWKTKHLALAKCPLSLFSLCNSLYTSQHPSSNSVITQFCWNCASKRCQIQWDTFWFLPSQSRGYIWRSYFWNTRLLAFMHLFLPVLLIHGFLTHGPSKTLGAPQDPLPIPAHTNSLVSSLALMALSPICWLALNFPRGFRLI